MIDIYSYTIDTLSVSYPLNTYLFLGRHLNWIYISQPKQTVGSVTVNPSQNCFFGGGTFLELIRMGKPFYVAEGVQRSVWIMEQACKGFAERGVLLF